MKQLLKVTVLSALIGIWLLSTTPYAHANFVMFLDDPATAGVDIIVVDDVEGGVGTATAIGASNTADGAAGAGVLNFNGALPGSVWSVNITTGISEPVIGSSGLATIDLNSVNVSMTGGGTLLIGLTNTGFIVNGQDTSPLALKNAFGGTTNGTITAQGLLDPANQEFAVGGVPIFLSVQGPLGPGAFASTVTATTGAPIGVNPLSLTELVTITHTGAGQITSFDKQLTAVVPEPGSLLLLGTGFLGLFGYGWRRRKRQVA